MRLSHDSHVIGLTPESPPGPTGQRVKGRMGSHHRVPQLHLLPVHSLANSTSSTQSGGGGRRKD